MDKEEIISRLNSGLAVHLEDILAHGLEWALELSEDQGGLVVESCN